MKAKTFLLILFFNTLLVSCAGPGSREPVEINLVALNDFHGYLQPSPFSYTDPGNPDAVITVQAGGVATLGGLLNKLRQDDPQLLFVGVGDLIGASPPISAMWADEPSLEAMKLLELRLSSLGNHELDEGKAELLRQINGGCDSPRPEKACQWRNDFSGAGFPYIAANLIDTETENTLVAPYVIETVRGIKIAFVGAQVEDLASVVSASSMQGIRVEDEAEAINRFIPAIKRKGADIVVAVVHQGGNTLAAFDQPDCTDLGGDIVDIVERLDPAVDLVLSAHTHEAYLCMVGDVPVTQAASYGRLVTHLTLVFEPAGKKLLDVQARNLIVDPQRYEPDPELLAWQATVEARSRAVLERPIARIGAATITRVPNRHGESAMGDLVADAQLAATQALGAQIALMNSGGIRSDLVLKDVETPLNFSQVAAVHPFKGTLQVISLTGAQIKAVLEQQWQGEGAGSFKPLQISHSFTYRWDGSQPRGQRVLADSLSLDGEPILPTETYRISVNAFLADGGDNFSALTEAGERIDTGIPDLKALTDYLVAQEKAGAPAGRAEPAERILRVD